MQRSEGTALLQPAPLGERRAASQATRTLMPPIISVANVSKRYASGFQALKNINLDIRRGEIFALLGPNGAGKTTLISIICGIVNASEGRVTVDGHDIVRDYRAARSMIGLVPQELTTDAFETVWATVSFSRGLWGKPPTPEVITPSVLKDAVAVGQEGQQDHDAVGRHEAARADRQGARARAADPVPRRADRRRRRRVAQGHVGGGARSARFRRHHHPHHALHRGSRADGRPHRHHQQGRDHPGRGQGRADAQARQEAAHAASAQQAGCRSRGAGRAPPDARRRRQRAHLHLRHAGRAHRHHRAAARPQRRPASASATCTPRKARSRTSSSTW